MPLDHQALYLVLQRTNLAHQVRGLVGGDRTSNDSARDTAGATQGHLAWNVNVGCVLVLTE